MAWPSVQSPNFIACSVRFLNGCHIKQPDVLPCKSKSSSRACYLLALAFDPHTRDKRLQNECCRRHVYRLSDGA